MFRLFSIIYSLASATLAGTGVVIALVAGFVDLRAILVAAVLGAAAALPAAWLVARRLMAT